MNEVLINNTYAEHFTQAPGMYASCVDAQHAPETTRVLASWGDTTQNTVSFVVADLYSKRFLDMISVGSRAALVAVSLTDLVAYQYKGSVTEVRPATQEELKSVDTYVEKFCELVVHAGIDPSRYPTGFVGGPYTTVTVDVDVIFDQTPRVGAGGTLNKKDN